MNRLDILRPTRLALLGWLALLGSWVGVSDVEATRYVPVSDATLTEQSELIVEARVAALELAPGSLPAVEYRLDVRRVIKGARVYDTVRVRIPGGVRDDGVAFLALGMPRFAVGDEVLFFLQPTGDGAYVPTGLMLGTFQLLEVDGRQVAVRDLAGSEAVPAPGTTYVPPDGVRDHRRFQTWLSELVVGHEHVVDYFVPIVGERPSLQTRANLMVSSSLPPPLGCGDTGGHNVRWFAFDLGQTVSWYRNGVLSTIGEPETATALDDAVTAWNDAFADSRISLASGGTTGADGGMTISDGINAVLFGDPNNRLPGTFDTTGILALGGPWFHCTLRDFDGIEYHEAIEADIVLQDGVESFFDASADPQAAAVELFAHEIGHTLGFGHSGESESLMWPHIHDDGRGASFHVHDIAGIEALYAPLPPGPSNPLPPGGEPPDTPEGFSAIVTVDKLVALSWDEIADDTVRVHIERSTNASVYAVLGSLIAENAFTDADVGPGDTYYYRVRAESSAGMSDYTDPVEISVPVAPPPAAPTNLRAAPLAADRIRLIWQDNADDELVYRIDVDSGNGFVELPVILQADTETVDLTGLTASTSIRARVRAEHLEASSEPSNVVAATTHASDAGCDFSDQTLCLLGGRFAVEVEWVDPADGIAAPAAAVPSTDNTGSFWFFDSANRELIVKMLDGGGINGHAWVFFGGLSNVEITLTVTDTETGETRTYVNPPGQQCGDSDILAFQIHEIPIDPPDPTTPVVLPYGSSLDDCGDDSLHTCLGGRFRVSVRSRDQFNGGAEGSAGAVRETADTGSFWFFGPDNVELVVKVLDGTGINGNHWVFWGALSRVEYWVTVVDTLLGTEKVYYNPPGELCGGSDIQAFSGN
ncbi:MAG: matrixin family metalloprotease [Acidobacteriota bacterium]